MYNRLHHHIGFHKLSKHNKTFVKNIPKVLNGNINVGDMYKISFRIHVFKYGNSTTSIIEEHSVVVECIYTDYTNIYAQFKVLMSSLSAIPLGILFSFKGNDYNSRFYILTKL